MMSAGKTLSKKNKIMHDHLSKFVEAHDSLNPKEQLAFQQKAATRASTAEASALQAKQLAAKTFAEGLSKKSDDELRDVIRQHVSPTTAIPHTVAHSKVKDNGTAVSDIKPMHSIADEHLANIKDLHVEHQGTTAVIKGTHAVTGKPMRAATFAVKSSSGPHKSLVGTFGLK